MTTKRALMVAVLALAIASLAVPLMGVKVRAAGPVAKPGSARVAATPVGSVAGTTQGVTVDGNSARRPVAGGEAAVSQAAEGKISAEVLKGLGINKLPKGTDSAAIGRELVKRKLMGKKAGSGVRADAETGPGALGVPEVMNATSALSAALITTIGGRDTQFSEVGLIADWDGREDCVADHGAKVDDFSFIELDIDQSLTRAAISEHTFANGFTENVFYYGDSVGNVWVGVDTTGDGFIEQVLQINLPTVLNAFGTLESDDQVTVTGLAVNPVADLTSFFNVNGAYDEFDGLTGEILYVTYMDTESGLRLTGSNTLVRSGLLAFPIADVISGAAAAPSPIDGSQVGFPVTVGGAFGVAFSVFSNVAGCSVDDDGSVYFQQVDLINFTGGNIVKVTDTGSNQDRSAATSGFITITTLNPAGGQYGTASGPPTQVNTFTNYSGTSTTFGNIVSLANGYGNVLYAAVARSFVATDDQFTQLTEGRFTNPSALGATPSMIISFADCSGAFDACTTPAGGFPGQIPVANGIADAASGGGTGTAGVNNFRVFVLGNGPDIRPPVGQSSSIVTSDTLKIDMQIDYTAHSGLAVSEEGTVYVISGGTPAGIGTNPSALLGEVLCFEDMCPMDRRADPVDLRGNAFPNPPASGGNVGDGDSDRFDHIFFQAPIDQVTLTPTGLAGLARGFLLYLNRTRTAPLSATDMRFANLPNGATQPDDGSIGTVIFEDFDLGHQAAGGDDQNTPFRGDDDNGAGTPVVAGPLSGGFEFVFGGPVGTAGCVWNGLFLNANGNVTFGVGDSSPDANVLAFRSGPPRIAPAWTDINPGSRDSGFLNTFPVQALGFANINAFKVRWINVPEFGFEDCGSRNTFAVTLYDDGTGIDENASQPLNPANPIGNNAVPFDLQEGPTDLRWTREPNTQILVGCSSRPQGSGIFLFEYARMDLLGTAQNPVIAGYSIGGLAITNPPGLCETNLSEAARAAETTFGVIQGQTAAIGCNCLLGEGTEPTIFELFNEGSGPSLGDGGEITFATPDFDLRFEGNDAAACTPSRQRDLNRGKVGFLGIGCAPPANPLCQEVQPVRPVAVAPNQPAVSATTTTGIINALCEVQLNIVGCGFFPNEVTIICQGFEAETGVPLQRPGKTVSTAATLACDTNGDGIPESVIALVNVTPVNCNLVRATIPRSATFGANSASGFPAACCGGTGTLTVTTTFSSGDNNIFGPFTRTVACNAPLGLRAPVVFSATPSDGNCAVPQDLIITGACFIINGPSGPITNVTSVFAVDRANSANVIPALAFQILGPNLIDADFNFGTANAGKTFLIFVSGPNGTSRNLTSAVAGAPAGCPLGNEQGVQVTFTCSTSTTPGTTPGSDIAVLTSCDLKRNNVSGKFTLDVFGSNIKQGASVTVNGQVPKKVKFKDLVSGTTDTFTRITLVKNVCNSLNGSASIVVTNPGTAGGPSAPLLCTETCPTN